MLELIKRFKRMMQLSSQRMIVRMVNDTQPRQRLQVQNFAGQIINNVPRMQNYGFSSHPPLGSEATIIALGGNQSNLVALAVEDKKSRLSGLLINDVAIYHADGHFIKLSKNQMVEVIGDTLNIRVKSVNLVADEVVITSPVTTFSGDISVGGNCNVTGNVSADSVSSASATIGGISFSGHKHIDSNGKPTSGAQ
jgi:phage baseplate assembly protein V